MMVGGPTQTNTLANVSGAGAPAPAAAAAAPNATGESIDANMGGDAEMAAFTEQFMGSIVQNTMMEGMQQMQQMSAEQEKKDKERQAEMKKG